MMPGIPRDGVRGAAEALVDQIGVILELYDRAWRGPAWHGPSVREALEGVTAAEAAAHPVPGAHSIWELAGHIAVWQDAVRHWIAGREFTVSPELDFPVPTDTSEAAWERLHARMQVSHDALRVAIAAFDPGRLEEPRGEARVPWYQVLHGVTHHDLYHAGQISLLRKAART